MILAGLMILAVGLAAIILLAVLMLRRHRENMRDAWRTGYRYAMHVHDLREKSIDKPLLEDGRVDGDSRGRAWRNGYLACLNMHGLPVTEWDAMELEYNDPYEDGTQLMAAAIGIIHH